MAPSVPEAVILTAGEPDNLPHRLVLRVVCVWNGLMLGLVAVKGLWLPREEELTRSDPFSLQLISQG